MNKSSWTRATACVILLLPLLSGCATAALQARPDDIPRLEQEAAQAPAGDAAVRLGQAYFAAGRFADAERVLNAAVGRGTGNGVAHLYLGLANEEQQDWAGARAAYEKYIEVGRDAGIRDDIRSRLGLVARAELKQQTKIALDREQVLSQEAPTPNTVAIMPFQMTGGGEDMRPLQTALADMMVTDLSVTRAVTPVERVRLQALLDEMLLGQAGFTETVTNRAGRLLKAENVVQGAITMTGERQIRIDGDVLRTEQRSSRGTVSGEQNVDAIFDLEKQIVFQVYDRLGVTLTPQERERINENRTSNLIAFIAYGRGLEALDRGNFTEAGSHFTESARLDPNFSRARAQRTEAAQLQQAAAVSTSEIAIAAGESTSTAVAPTMSSSDLLLQTAAGVNDNPGLLLTSQGTAGDGATGQNNVRGGGAQEAQGNGSGGLGNVLRATIRIIIHRPGN